MRDERCAVAPLVHSFGEQPAGRCAVRCHAIASRPPSDRDREQRCAAPGSKHQPCDSHCRAAAHCALDVAAEAPPPCAEIRVRASAALAALVAVAAGGRPERRTYSPSAYLPGAPYHDQAGCCPVP